MQGVQIWQAKLRYCSACLFVMQAERSAMRVFHV